MAHKRFIKEKVVSQQLTNYREILMAQKSNTIEKLLQMASKKSYVPALNHKHKYDLHWAFEDAQEKLKAVTKTIWKDISLYKKINLVNNMS